MENTKTPIFQAQARIANPKATNIRRNSNLKRIELMQIPGNHTRIMELTGPKCEHEERGKVPHFVQCDLLLGVVI